MMPNDRQHAAAPRPSLRSIAVLINVIGWLLPMRAAVGLLSWLANKIISKSMTVASDVADAMQHPIVHVPVPGVPDVGVTVFAPAMQSPTLLPLVVWMHGGAWVAGSAAQAALQSRALAARGYVVASIDYSLAPHQHYPTPVLQMVAALAYLKEHAHRFGGDPARLIIGGESAGAQLASQLGVVLSNPDYAQRLGIVSPVPADWVRAVVLYNGVYNVSTMVNCGFPGAHLYLHAYFGRPDYMAAPRIAEMSSARHVTAHYPPTYIVAGDADPLESESYQMDAVLRALGVKVRSRYWTGTASNLEHGFMATMACAAAWTVLEDTVAFIDEHARASPPPATH